MTKTLRQEVGIGASVVYEYAVDESQLDPLEEMEEQSEEQLAEMLHNELATTSPEVEGSSLDVKVDYEVIEDD